MLYIKEPHLEDSEKIYNFIQAVPYSETGFFNLYLYISKENFNELCIKQLIKLSNLQDINGSLKPMTTYFLWLNNKIIGIYHILHKLDEKLKNTDGHISYTILKEYRNQGYASKGLELVLEKAKKIIKEDEIYMHTSKNNIASLKVQLNNGAYIVKETENDYYTRIKIK